MTAAAEVGFRQTIHPIFFFVTKDYQTGSSLGMISIMTPACRKATRPGITDARYDAVSYIVFSAREKASKGRLLCPLPVLLTIRSRVLRCVLRGGRYL